MAQTYQVGQRWKFRAGHESGTLVIGRIDRPWFGRQVIHIWVESSQLPIAHMPFSPEAIDQRRSSRPNVA